MKRKLTDRCAKCGLVWGRHHCDTEACPKSRKRSPSGGEIPGMRWVLKGEFKKYAKFEKMEEPS